jgi:hypothetical protein
MEPTQQLENSIGDACKFFHRALKLKTHRLNQVMMWN